MSGHATSQYIFARVFNRLPDCGHTHLEAAGLF
jgi:hypothetical protein